MKWFILMFIVLITVCLIMVKVIKKLQFWSENKNVKVPPTVIVFGTDTAYLYGAIDLHKVKSYKLDEGDSLSLTITIPDDRLPEVTQDKIDLWNRSTDSSYYLLGDSVYIQETDPTFLDKPKKKKSRSSKIGKAGDHTYFDKDDFYMLNDSTIGLKDGVVTHDENLSELY